MCLSSVATLFHHHIETNTLQYPEIIMMELSKEKRLVYAAQPL